MGRFRALPYAKALLSVVEAKDASAAERVAEELDRVAATISQVPEFLRVLVTPMVDSDRKSAILESVMDELEIGEPTRRFLHVVQSHYRMLHMRDIASAYRELVDRRLGRVRARIETTQDLPEADRQRLLAAVADFEGSEVVADFAANRELLGGFKLQIGSRVFDGSLAGELDRLSRQIEIEQG